MKKRKTLKAKIDGQWCIVIEREDYYTKVLTPFHEILDVANNDIEELCYYEI